MRLYFLRSLFLLDLLLDNRIFFCLLRCRWGYFEVKFLGCDFFKRSDDLSLAILWQWLVITSEFLIWIRQLSLYMMLRRRNTEHHVRVVCFKATIVKRRKRKLYCLLILLVMPCSKQIAMLVIVCVVKVWVLEEIHTFHHTMLIVS